VADQLWLMKRIREEEEELQHCVRCGLTCSRIGNFTSKLRVDELAFYQLLVH